MGVSALHTYLESFGYTDVRQIAGKLCGLQRFLFTTGLVVGIHQDSHEYRYCYERHEDALAALAAWDGSGQPSGPWIKLKGRINGCPVDLLNPALLANESRTVLRNHQRRHP